MSLPRLRVGMLFLLGEYRYKSVKKDAFLFKVENIILFNILYLFLSGQEGLMAPPSHTTGRADFPHPAVQPPACCLEKTENS